MTDKAKLVELLINGGCDRDCKDCEYYGIPDCEWVKMAEYLMDNDVTIQKTGRWLEVRFADRVEAHRCSKCNTTWDEALNYCPMCGAKMEE